MELNTVRSQSIDHLHGMKVYDPFRWLEDRVSDETEHWLAGQRRRFTSYFENYNGFDLVRERVRRVLWEDALDQPALVNDQFFYRLRHRDDEYASLYTQSLLDGNVRLLVNPSEFGPYTSVSLRWLNDDASLGFISLRRGGSDAEELFLLDVISGQITDCCLAAGRTRGIVFAPERQGYYFSHDAMPSTTGHSIRFCPFDRSKLDDRVILKLPASERSRLILFGDCDRLGAFHLRSVGGLLLSDFYIAMRSSDDKWISVFRDAPATVVPTLKKGHIFLQSFKTAKNGAVIEIDQSGNRLRTIVPEREYKIHKVTMSETHIYAQYSEHLGPSIHSWQIDGAYCGPVDTPTDGTVRLLPAYSMRSQGLFYEYQSFASPPTIRYLDADRHKQHGIATISGNSRVSSDLKISEVSYRGKDGTEIPLTLIMRADLPSISGRSVIMTSYGGFGVSLTPQFSVLNACMVGLGAVLALPHIRGGGDFGEDWHAAAVGLGKQTTFDDFIAAAEWLCDQGITSPKHLAIFGGSNAGLLTAVAMTQRPELFAAVVCIGPLLDMVRYERFDRASRWRDEYGTVERADEFRALYQYSPYHRVNETTNYPATLFVTGDRDERCNPAHVRKMAARLQNGKSQINPILVDYHNERGHSPGLPTSDRISSLTSRIAFLCNELGIDIGANR